MRPRRIRLVALLASCALALSLGGCFADNQAANWDYCQQNPYAEPCGGTTK